MNTTQAKSLNLPALLAQLGHHPVKTTNQGQELWYHSPFRKDKTPSFHTSFLNGKWIWNDFGDIGGTVVDFALRHLATNDISLALNFLAELTGRVGEGEEDSLAPHILSPPLGAGGLLGAGGPILQLLSTAPVSNPLILNYLTQTRRIPEPLIRRYLSEITYRNTTTGQQYFAFGIPNQAGGYEIRSASDEHPFKSVIGPRDVTHIPGTTPTAGIVSIFEGTLDFLSLLAIMDLPQLPGDAIVMHSLSSYQKTAAVLLAGNYQTINLFLDNDQSGAAVASRFLREFPAAVNQSELFRPFDDLNAFWVSNTSKASIPVDEPKDPIYATLEEARAREAQLQKQLQELIDRTCRTVFQKHRGAKASAFEAAKQQKDSGYLANRSIAENMEDKRFREVFKRIVEQQYPDEFVGLVELRQAITEVQQLIVQLKK